LLLPARPEIYAAQKRGLEISVLLRINSLRENYRVTIVSEVGHIRKLIFQDPSVASGPFDSEGMGDDAGRKAGDPTEQRESADI
jgi:hypothetical protein